MTHETNLALVSSQVSQTSQTSQTLIHEFEFQLSSMPGVWLKTDVTTTQSLSAIKTGLLHNQSLSKIKLFTVSDDDTTISYIYDVLAAKQGIQAWSTQTD